VLALQQGLVQCGCSPQSQLSPLSTMPLPHRCTANVVEGESVRQFSKFALVKSCLNDCELQELNEDELPNEEACMMQPRGSGHTQFTIKK